MSKHRPPLTSDAEHARTIDPVLTRGAAVWIHEALPAPPLTVIGGRAFTYRDVDYNPVDAPVLKVRTIDGDQTVPFLMRIVVAHEGQVPSDAAVTVAFPAPNVFDPRLENISAWVGSDPARASLEHSLEDARIEVRIPLTDDSGDGERSTATSTTVIVDGELVLAPYTTVPPRRFADPVGMPVDPAVDALARLEPGRDVADLDERQQIQRVADKLFLAAPNAYDRVLAINSWVSSRLRYRESAATLSPGEILQEQSGDCDEYTSLMVALLRAKGLPARRASGLLYDFDTLAAHAWVEVALTARNGRYHWFIADPTLAGTTPLEGLKEEYVQFRDRIHLYPMKPTIDVEGTAGRHVTHVFLNWREAKEKRTAEPSALDRFVEATAAEVDFAISSGAERLVKADLMLQRESASIAGSPYLIVDRPLTEDHPNTLQLRLENEERLVLELIAGSGSALDTETDQDAIERLRSAYADLNGLFFSGRAAYHNLDLVYSRDRHSDRLQRVSLRFGRYLTEHSLDRILKELEKERLLTHEEAASISAVAEASAGRNLYVLQELARRVPSGESP
jgi:transglutaminase-like putative cysteine protease